MRQGLKFLVVGAMAAVSELALFGLLHNLLGMPLIAANVTSFSLGLLISFTLNKNWSFQAENHSLRTQYQFGVYTGIALINVVISSLLLKQFVAWGLAALVAKVLVMGLIASWNFVFYQRVIFRQKDSEAGFDLRDSL